ncbi:MAG: hypothetical protein WD431_11855 [Cyclobacteriaceae bacterium]
MELFIFIVLLIVIFAFLNRKDGSSKIQPTVTMDDIELKKNIERMRVKFLSDFEQAQDDLSPYYLTISMETLGVVEDYDKNYKNLENWPEIDEISWYVFNNKRELIKKEYFNESEASMKDAYKLLSEDIKSVRLFISHNHEYTINILKSNFYRKKLPVSVLTSRVGVCVMEKGKDAVLIWSDFHNDWKYPKLHELVTGIFFPDDPISFLESEQLEGPENKARAIAKCFSHLVDHDYIPIKDFFEK